MIQRIVQRRNADAMPRGRLGQGFKSGLLPISTIGVGSTVTGLGQQDHTQESTVIKLEDPLRDATIQDLVSWLEGQDPEKKYCYHDCCACLLCEFLKAHGVENPRANPLQWGDDSGVRYPLPYWFNRISIGINVEEDWTYGAALERARIFDHWKPENPTW